MHSRAHATPSAQGLICVQLIDPMDCIGACKETHHAHTSNTATSVDAYSGRHGIHVSISGKPLQLTQAHKANKEGTTWENTALPDSRRSDVLYEQPKPLSLRLRFSPNTTPGGPMDRRPVTRPSTPRT